MIKIFLFLLMLTTNCFATTWYVRSDGGTRTQCDGQHDAAYPGSGTNQACAYIHPWLALGWINGSTNEDTGKMSAGDTLQFSKTGDSFTMSYDGYNSAVGASPTGCSSGAKTDCHNYPPPSGSDSSHRTMILGLSSTNLTQLVGGDNIYDGVLFIGGNVNEGGSASSHLDIENLDISDHDSCVGGGTNPPSPSCTDAGRAGIKGRGNDDVVLRYDFIHGLYYAGIQSQGASNWTYDHVTVLRNGFVGINFDSDNGEAALDSTGAFTMEHSRVGYSGCGETYPGLQPTNCWGQDDISGHLGYGDGLGWGNSKMGQWTITDSLIDHNTQDGFDGLHSYDSGDYVHSARSIYEGNDGQQIKVQDTFVSENDFFIGDCNYFDGQSFTYSGFARGTAGDDSIFCRARGNTIFLGIRADEVHSITGATILGIGDVGVSTEGSSCNANTKIKIRNSLLLGGQEYSEDSSLFTGGTDVTAALFFTTDDGGCSGSYYDEDYNQIYTWRHGSSDVTGAHSRYGDPLVVGPINKGSGSYSNNDDLHVLMYLTSSSPSRYAVTGANSADESLVSGEISDLTIDNNSVSRGANWDGSAVQYQSCLVGNSWCFYNADCCSGSCSNNVCAGGSSINISGKYHLNGSISL